MNKKQRAIVSEYVITRDTHANITPDTIFWTVPDRVGEKPKKNAYPTDDEDGDRNIPMLH
jgi:hypothetical protein